MSLGYVSHPASTIRYFWLESSTTPSAPIVGRWRCRCAACRERRSTDLTHALELKFGRGPTKQSGFAAPPEHRVSPRPVEVETRK